MRSLLLAQALRCRPPSPLRSLCTSPVASQPPSPSPLLHDLHRQIRFHGPLTVPDYMRHCLLHPTHGYYTTAPSIFGPTGDFITSPDISPIFAELLAVFLAHHHHRAPSPPPYVLIELGPGNASLLSAALPALSALSAAPASILLVERSDPLRDRQRTVLARPHLPPVRWASSLDEALAQLPPDAVPIFLAHEFLDALPIHVFDRVSPSHAWRERLVDAADISSPSPSPSSAALRFVRAAAPTPALELLDVFPPAASATLAEIGAESAAVAEAVARAVAARGGLGVFIDYGHDGIVDHDSLRAFKNHRQVDVLSEPGRVDVTADVDFAQLRAAVARAAETDGVRLRGPVSQRNFLLGLGAAARFRKVAQGVIERGQRDGESDEMVDKKLERLQADYEKLVGEREMGKRYKVAVIARDADGDVAGGFPR